MEGRISTLQRRLHAISNRLINRNETRDQSETAETDTDFVTEFRRFRRAPSTTSTGGRRRGGKVRTFTKTFVLVDGHLTKVNIRKSNAGQSEEEKKKKLQLPLSMSPESFREKLTEEFPSLQGTEFQLCRCGTARSGRELQPFPDNVTCPQGIKEWGGLKRSCIYIRPHSEIRTVREPLVPESGTPTVSFREQSRVETEDIDELSDTMEVVSDGLPEISLVDEDAETGQEEVHIIAEELGGDHSYEVSQRGTYNFHEGSPASDGGMASTTDIMEQGLNSRSSSLPSTGRTQAQPVNNESNAQVLPEILPSGDNVHPRETVSTNELGNDGSSVSQNGSSTLHEGSPFSDGGIATTTDSLERGANSGSSSLLSTGQTQAQPVNNEHNADTLPETLPSGDNVHPRETDSTNEAGDGTQIPQGNMVRELKDAFESLRSSLHPQPRHIIVRRDNLLHDVINIYRESGIELHTLKVEFQSENGLDMGGLTKDMLTTAWKDAIQKYFRGDAAVVPFLPLHLMRRLRNDFIPVGRILTHTAALCMFLPGRLSRSFFLSLVYGGEGVSDEVAIADFLLYVTCRERKLLTRARDDFNSLTDAQLDEISSIYGMYGLCENPSSKDFNDQLLTMARSEMVDRPGPLVQLIKTGIPHSHIELFWCLLTTDGIDHLYRSQRATPDKLIEVLGAADVLLPAEENALYLLKSFIRSLDQEDLEAFLIFVTASTILPGTFTVTFNQLNGLRRRPIAHTCTNTLDLPTTYSSLHELKREFRAVLSDPASSRMDSA